MVCLDSSQTNSAISQGKLCLPDLSPKAYTSLAVLKTQFDLDSPIQVLRRMVMVKESGKIVIADPRDESVAWEIYVGTGEIHYATSLVGQSERLGYLQQYSDFIPASAKPKSVSDYQFICSLWQAGRLTLAQLRQVLILITQDTLVQVLKLPRALIRVEKTLGLDPLLMSVPLAKLLVPIQVQLRQWQTVQAEIASPLQRPAIQNRLQWQRMIHDPGQSLPRLQFIAPLLEGHLCLYQVAQEMGMSLLEILPLLRVLLQQNVLKMRPYAKTQVRTRPAIACIDTDALVRASVKLAFEASGFDTVALQEPSHLWSALDRYQPAMVLLDVDRFDGHNFVKTLQQSNQLKFVPIVALTEHPGMFNRFWARHIGAIDCLIKPFAPNALNHLVRQLVA